MTSTCYHNSDFEFEVWANYCLHHFTLPHIININYCSDNINNDDVINDDVNISDINGVCDDNIIASDGSSGATNDDVDDVIDVASGDNNVNIIASDDENDASGENITINDINDVNIDNSDAIISGVNVASGVNHVNIFNGDASDAINSGVINSDVVSDPIRDIDVVKNETTATHGDDDTINDTINGNGMNGKNDDVVAWDSFYRLHLSARVYKPRNYIFIEFEPFITSSILHHYQRHQQHHSDHEGDNVELRMLEVGCGHGCTMFPLLQRLSQLNSSSSSSSSIVESSSSSSSIVESSSMQSSTLPLTIHYIASDCSKEALSLLSMKCDEIGLPNSCKVSILLWNCEQPFTQTSIDVMHAIYTSSTTHIADIRNTSESFIDAAVIPSHGDVIDNVMSTNVVDSSCSSAAMPRDIVVDDSTKIMTTTHSLPSSAAVGLDKSEPILRGLDIILSIFALSSLPPTKHSLAFRNIYEILRDGGVFLFRDYGIHDMTMYRHKKRCGETLFQRPEGTFAYYFSVEYLERLAIEIGFEVVELSYACVMLSNRKHRQESSDDGDGVVSGAQVSKGNKKSREMRRVFVHAVFRKPIPS